MNITTPDGLNVYGSEYGLVVKAHEHNKSVGQLTKERDMWKSNHDNQVRLRRALMDRPDLKERAALVQSLDAERLLALADAEAMRECMQTPLRSEAEYKQREELARTAYLAMQARAEAAESLVMELRDGLSKIAELPTGQLASPEQCSAVVLSMDLLALTPAAMVSKLAELEKELKVQSEAKEEYRDRVEVLADLAGVPFPRSFETAKVHINGLVAQICTLKAEVGCEDEMFRAAESRIAEQDAELARLRDTVKEQAGSLRLRDARLLKYDNAMSDLGAILGSESMGNTEVVAGVRQLIAQSDALIAAGDMMSRYVVVTGEGHKVRAAWDAAKQGAQPTLDDTKNKDQK